MCRSRDLWETRALRYANDEETGTKLRNAVVRRIEHLPSTLIARSINLTEKPLERRRAGLVLVGQRVNILNDEASRSCLS